MARNTPGRSVIKSRLIDFAIGAGIAAALILASFGDDVARPGSNAAFCAQMQSMSNECAPAWNGK